MGTDIDLGKINGWADLFSWFKDEIKDQIKVSTLAFYDSTTKAYDSSSGYGIAKVIPFPLAEGEEQYYIEAFFFGDVTFTANQRLLVCFTDKNFIKNLSFNVPKETKSLLTHSNTFGVIVGTTGGGGSSSGVTDVKQNGTSVVTDTVANVTVPTKTSDLTNDSGFVTNETASIAESQVTNLTSDLAGKENSSNKVTTISASSTDTEFPTAKCTYDAISDVREIAEGRTKNYVCSYVTNPGLNSQNESITITSALTDINGDTIQLSSLKVGDNIYIDETDTVPDRWVSVAGSSSVTLYKIAASEVPIVSISKNGTTIAPVNRNVDISVPIVDQTYSASSTNAQSGVAVASAISGKSTVSGVNDGTNWTSITIDGTTKTIPSGSSGFTTINWTFASSGTALSTDQKAVLTSSFTNNTPVFAKIRITSLGAVYQGFLEYDGENTISPSQVENAYPCWYLRYYYDGGMEDWYGCTLAMEDDGVVYVNATVPW